MAVVPNPDGMVKSCKTDGSDVTTIIPSGVVHTPKQITINEDSHKIYLCDREGLRVLRRDLDGSNLETLIQTGDWHNTALKDDTTNWCVGIAIAPSLGKIFWTQKGPSKGGKGRIFTANIDIPAGETASKRFDVECLLDHLAEPVDLEWDEKSRTLFWTDRGEVPFGNTLNRAVVGKSLGGKLKHEIIAQNFDEAIGLKLDHATEHIYVSDIGGTVWRCNFDGSEKSVVFQDKTDSFTGLTLI